MNTSFLLLARYESPVVPLEQICADYLNLSAKKAQEMASLNKLPFPTFRMNDSQKAPRLVHLSDLAEFIDKQRVDAKNAWRRSQVPGAA
ncbi:pyocin activator PrtN family protein [Chromobacterium amazonense]|uniref:pyocin activator PrtN family protein n=1 Tax=Chromobacterium amazonense TaxID=1382803 RepID=UPI00237D5DF0|nr:pyocin activator PrtN family protein [Chromobacterium amazonense]MDE1715793.1 pyocin activator PrtN family protein [Chromobacterium amazonense]